MPSTPSALSENPADSALKNPASTIDLRSDTVTRPTAAMRAAMASAEVGDDVYAEDPTVNLLEARAAEVFGREAAIFVPTGTMGNQIAIRLHTHHGQEVITESRAHVVDWEMAMAAAFSGVQLRTVFAERGIVTWQHIEQMCRKGNDHRTGTGLIALENTHNMAGGTVTPLDIYQDIWWRATELRLPLQRTLCTRRFHARRQPRLHRARPARPQGARRRHAPGRYPCRCRPHRPRRNAEAPLRRPLQRPLSCREPRRASPGRNRSHHRPDQHRHLHRPGSLRPHAAARKDETTRRCRGHRSRPSDQIRDSQRRRPLCLRGSSPHCGSGHRRILNTRPRGCCRGYRKEFRTRTRAKRLYISNIYAEVFDCRPLPQRRRKHHRHVRPP